MKQRPKFRGNELQNEVDKEYKNDEMEMTIKSFNEVKTTEIDLKEGDTLQALSIRYHCPISELKRLNNLHRENEIFARRTIKVPYRHFSVAAVHNSGENSPDANLTHKRVDASLLKQKLTSVSTNSPENENNFNRIIFNTTIAQKPEEIEEESEENSDEEIQLLPKVEIHEESTTDFSCSGADWGLSWPILLGIILIIAFIGPLIYIFYIAEHPEQYHHHS